MMILKTNNEKDEKFLRVPVPKLDFTFKKPEELRRLARAMRETMGEANGIGLSANQVGLSKRLFIVELPGAEGERKFYAIVNPEIVKKSEEISAAEEGCLSIPGVYGLVSRPREITLSGFSPFGKRLKIKAWGLLARVFQHELDHLDGILFIDKATNMRQEKPTDFTGQQI